MAVCARHGVDVGPAIEEQAHHFDMSAFASPSEYLIHERHAGKHLQSADDVCINGTHSPGRRRRATWFAVSVRRLYRALTDDVCRLREVWLLLGRVL